MKDILYVIYNVNMFIGASVRKYKTSYPANRKHQTFAQF